MMAEDEINLLTYYRQLNADGQAYLMCLLKMMCQEEALTKSYVEREGIRYMTKGMHQIAPEAQKCP